MRGVGDRRTGGALPPGRGVVAARQPRRYDRSDARAQVTARSLPAGTLAAAKARSAPAPAAPRPAARRASPVFSEEIVQDLGVAGVRKLRAVCAGGDRPRGRSVVSPHHVRGHRSSASSETVSAHGCHAGGRAPPWPLPHAPARRRQVGSWVNRLRRLRSSLGRSPVADAHDPWTSFRGAGQLHGRQFLRPSHIRRFVRQPQVFG